MYHNLMSPGRLSQNVIPHWDQNTHSVQVDKLRQNETVGRSHFFYLNKGNVITLLGCTNKCF